MLSTDSHAPGPTVLSPASEPGALDGYETTCSCGFVSGSLFESTARRSGRDHADYMNAKESRS